VKGAVRMGPMCAPRYNMRLQRRAVALGKRTTRQALRCEAKTRVDRVGRHQPAGRGGGDLGVGCLADGERHLGGVEIGEPAAEPRFRLGALARLGGPPSLNARELPT
jgi:hypothetical protein